jgi:hypothetical protein
VAKLKKKKAIVHDIITNNEELVIEKSKNPIVNGMILLIENCSKGEKKKDIIKILTNEKE